jgi:hypothetical protein
MKTYGRIIPGLEIDGKPAPYPVVNERSIRATAGLMMIIGLFTFGYINKTGDYTVLPVVVGLFWLEFFLKAVIDPKWSLFGVIGDFLVLKQKPEWVGAIQKRFAWSLGLMMATLMLIVAVFMQIRGWLPLSICMTCLTFMWFESAAGICVGCKIYGFLLKRGVLSQPEVRPACPGGVCSLGKKNE